MNTTPLKTTPRTAPLERRRHSARHSLFLAAALFLGGFAAAPAQNCDTLISQGRQALAASDLPTAWARFQSAAATCPNNEEAAALAAIARVLYLPYDSAGTNLLDRLGFIVTQRNIFDWEGESPHNAPAGVSAKELAGYARGAMLSAFGASAADLARILNSSFRLRLSAAETHTDPMTLDYGDILMLQASMQFGQYLCYTLATYNTDVQLPLLQQVATNALTLHQLLDDHSDLLAFATLTDLAPAKAAFTNGAALYLAASTYIRSRPASTGATFLFQWDQDEDPKNQRKEADFRKSLADIRDSLAAPKVLSTATNLTVNLANHFAGATTWRSLLPLFRTNDNAFWANTLPDPTFGGILLGANRAEIESGFGGGVAPDTRYSLLAKGKCFVQTSDSPPVPATNGPSIAGPLPYATYAAVESASYEPARGYWGPPETDTILGASLLIPESSVPLIPESVIPLNMPGFRPHGGSPHDGRVHSTFYAFPDLATLNASVPVGPYVFAITNLSDGLLFRTNTTTFLPAENDFPAVPRVQNWAATQQIDTSRDFLLQWNAPAGGGAVDFIQVTLIRADPYSTTIYRSPQPWEPAALTGAATSILLPKSVLSSGSMPASVTARILFGRRLAAIPGTPPGAPGDIALYSQTEFALGLLPSSSPDYSFYRTANYMQTNAAALIAGVPAIAYTDDACALNSVNTSAPFATEWNDYSSSLDTLGFSPVDITFPSGRISSSSYGATPFTTQGAMNNDLPGGIYTIRYNNQPNPAGPVSVQIALPSSPVNPPVLANFDAAQAIDPTADFTLTWSGSGDSADLVDVGYSTICSASSYAFYSPSCWYFTPLPSSAASCTIPAGTLDLGQTYLFTIQVRRGSRSVGALTPLSLGEAFDVIRTRVVIKTRASIPPLPSGPPVILTAPAPQQLAYGATAQFSVVTRNATAFTYQWFKDGVALHDGLRFSGSQSPVLVIQGINTADLGGYTVRLANALGATNSDTPASLLLLAGLAHSADTDQNNKISLLELTRVIELYNFRANGQRTGQYHLQLGTEDGFAPGPGDYLSSPHTADTDANGRLSLLELTRVIELYNFRANGQRSGLYHPQPGTEDGFAPGP